MISVVQIWLLIGLILILFEFVAPGLIAIFFGMGAITVGLLISAGMSSGGALPILVFSGTSLGYLLLLRRFFKNWFAGRSLTAQETGGDDDFIGRIAEVASGFESEQVNYGRVMYRGTLWDAETDKERKLAIGDKVRIVDRKNAILIVGASPEMADQ